MQISNKLVTADFVELQKILMEDYKPSPSFIFTLKYVTNFLYGLVVFSAFYFINWAISSFSSSLNSSRSSMVIASSRNNPNKMINIFERDTSLAKTPGLL